MTTGTLLGYSRNSESVCFIHVALPEEERNEFVKTWWKTELFAKEVEVILESLERTTCDVDGSYQVGLF